MYDLIIIGGGPAGITAGIYASRKGLKTLLLTRDFLGQTAKTSEVDNWPGQPAISGLKLMESFAGHLKKFDLTIKADIEAVELKKRPAGKSGFLVLAGNKEEFSGQSLILAAGRKPRLLGVKGEKELAGRGVSYCSTCDAPFFKNKRAAVAGSGNAGLEAALDLSAYAGEVFVLEKGREITADVVLKEKAVKTGKIKFLLNRQVERIEGKNKVESIAVKNSRTGREEKIKAEGIFVQIGSRPVSDFLKGFVELNSRGEVKVDCRTGQTSLKGVFAAGDITDSPYKQIITASADGCRAALSAYEYLQKHN